MRILVTGAAGMLGLDLCDAAAAEYFYDNAVHQDFLMTRAIKR